VAFANEFRGLTLAQGIQKMGPDETQPTIESRAQFLTDCLKLGDRVLQVPTGSQRTFERNRNDIGTD
jgi:hypothetical protein